MEDLVQEAERLTAEISGSGGSSFPFARVERNLKQLAETGHELWSRTVASAHMPSSSSSSSRPSSAQVSASILLGSRGYDLTKVTQQLDSLTSGKQMAAADAGTRTGTRTDPTARSSLHQRALAAEAADTAVSSADPAVQSFLKSERESAILSAVQHVKRTTFDQVDQLFWQCLQQEWQEEKVRILRTTLTPDQPAADHLSLTGIMDQTMVSVTGTPAVGIRDARMVTSTPAATDQQQAGKGGEGRKILDSVLQLIREGKAYDHITGSIQTDGCRTPGSLDKLRSTGLNVDNLIEEAAVQAEREAFLEEAVKLYDMAGAHGKALEILNKLLAAVVSSSSSSSTDSISSPNRERIEAMALRMAERYAVQGHSAPKSLSGTFFLLLDLMTFFTYYQRQSLHDALDTISKLDVVPLTPAQLDPLVHEFRKLAIEVQRTVPDILVACMNILYAMYRETKLSTATTPAAAAMHRFSSGASPGNTSASPSLMTTAGSSPDGSRDQRLQDLRHKARTLITFAGMIPYRMAADVNAKLVQLEVLMS